MASRPPVVGLSDQQLDKLLDEAHSIDPEYRSRFLIGVIDALMPLEHVTNTAVERACWSIAVKMRAAKGKTEQELRRA